MTPSGTAKACAPNTCTNSEVPLEVLERGEQFRSGEDRDVGANREEDAVGDGLATIHSFRRDESDTDHRTGDVGDEETKDGVADTEPAEPESEHQAEPHVTEAEGARADGVHAEEEHEPDDTDEDSDDETMPLIVVECGADERDHLEGEHDVDHPLRQDEELGVDHAEGAEPRDEYEERRQIRAVADARRCTGEENRRRELYQWVTRRDGLATVSTASVKDEPGDDGDVVPGRDRLAAARTG